MNEQKLRTLLHNKANDVPIPPHFDDPATLLLKMKATRRKTFLRRTLPRLAAAAALVLAIALPLAQPARAALAMLGHRLGWISASDLTTDEQVKLYANAKPAPAMPAEVEEQARADVAETLKAKPFIHPIGKDGWTLEQELARYPVRFGPTGEWTVDRTSPYYSQIYRLAGSRQVTAGQYIVIPPKEGPLFEFPADTEEIEINGYTAYVSTRQLGTDDEGKTVVREFPRIDLFAPLDNERGEWLHIRVTSQTASLEAVQELATLLSAQIK